MNELILAQWKPVYLNKETGEYEEIKFEHKEITMQTKINEAYKQAMLNKEDDKKRVLNSVKAEIKNKEIELRTSGKQITDADILSLIQKMIKQNNDAIEMFKQGNRADLVGQNLVDNAILESFLPNQLSDDEIKNIIAEQCEQLGCTSIKDMGKLMGYFKTNYSGQCDMGKVSNLIKERFNAK